MKPILMKTDDKTSRYTMRNPIILSVLLVLTASFSAIAQEKETDEKEEEEGIGTEVVDVVKSYTPTISDANKIQEKPSLNDSITTTKKNIDYTIFSVPVASTFTPSKGKATTLKKAAREQLYNSYLSLGLGNYNTALVDFYTSRDFNRDETFDVLFNHHSSQGDIDGVVLDNNFFDTALELHYRQRNRYMNWGVFGGIQHQIYNWYGLPPDRVDEADNIDERQNYFTGVVGGDLEFEDSYFKGGRIYYRFFNDRFKTGENRAVMTPKFQFPAGEEMINIDLILDYVGGNFDRFYTNEDQLDYSNALVGVTPGIQILGDDVTVNLGASVFYNHDLESSNNDVFFYPDVSVSYDIVNEYVTAYGGVDGQLKQNSFYDFAQENPYISPTVEIMPTDQQYNAYVGVKGRFLPKVGYNLKGSYINENHKPLYRSNSFYTGPDSGVNNAEGYAYGNSFGVIYDDVTTISVFGEVTVDLEDDFSLGVNAEFFDYNTEDQAEAWNLPIVKSSLFFDYQIAKWSVGANVFYVGQREDHIDSPSFLESRIVNLEGYFDINANLGYEINKQWSAFIRANNIGNSQYERMVYYPVQGVQIMAGAAFKFDL
ncbi:TonB-dependent receptor [Galbibacter sp. EGI 63066]|uniref:TonB-dependent receptor n=1 Tax=Galbibacter sp. EGI 63066 TaxID=2993559 RepID=UPI002248B758|nr:TonB-dependent receptor [Galbibacter sp. EGI 63066]MCX2679557.1 TonB-dependent receptor [Galbibacter sp. EGI 63066]